MVLDNASYHKSKAVREYVESAGGDVELEFLPPYTPQLNVEGPEEEACRQVLPVARRAVLEREMGNRLKGSCSIIKLACTNTRLCTPIAYDIARSSM